MKHSFTEYFLQSRISVLEPTPQVVGHSKDEETGEIYYKFFSRKEANDLMKAEQKVSPEYQYRVVKETNTFDEGVWE